MEGEFIDESKKAIIFNFDASVFLKQGKKVDVKFDNKFWYCGEIERVTKKQVLVKIVNGDESVRMKPVPNEIRVCSHEPQLSDFSF